MAPALPARFTGFRRREAEGWADHSVRWFWANNHEPIEEARRSHLVQIWQTIGKFLFRLRDLLQSPISWNFFFLFLSCLFLTMKLIHCYITLRGSRVTITWHWRNVAWTSHGWLLPLRHSWFCFRVRRCVGWLTADQPPISVTFPSQPADCACGIYMAAVAFHPNPMLSRHFH